jgi:hypothetical protein
MKVQPKKAVSDVQRAAAHAAANIQTLLTRADAIMTVLENDKPLYEELDNITLQLKALGFEQGAIGTRLLALVDNFAEKNTAFRPCGVKRFELKTLKPPKGK